MPRTASRKERCCGELTASSGEPESGLIREKHTSRASSKRTLSSSGSGAIACGDCLRRRMDGLGDCDQGRAETPSESARASESVDTESRATSRCTVLVLTITPASANASRMFSKVYPSLCKRAISTTNPRALRLTRPGPSRGFSVTGSASFGPRPKLLQHLASPVSMASHCLEPVRSRCRIGAEAVASLRHEDGEEGNER